jgi:hypothetical protein
VPEWASAHSLEGCTFVQPLRRGGDRPAPGGSVGFRNSPAAAPVRYLKPVRLKLFFSTEQLFCGVIVAGGRRNCRFSSSAFPLLSIQNPLIIIGWLSGLLSRFALF